MSTTHDVTRTESDNYGKIKNDNLNEWSANFPTIPITETNVPLSKIWLCISNYNHSIMSNFNFLTNVWCNNLYKLFSIFDGTMLYYINILGQIKIKRINTNKILHYCYVHQYFNIDNILTRSSLWCLRLFL